MTEGYFVASDSGSGSATLDVETYRLTWQHGVISNVNLILGQGFDHNPSTFEVGKRWIPNEAVRVHSENASAVWAIHCVTLKVTFVDLEPWTRQPSYTGYLSIRFLLDATIERMITDFQKKTYSSDRVHPFSLKVPERTSTMQYISSGLCAKNSRMHFSLATISKFMSTWKLRMSLSRFGPFKIILKLFMEQKLPSPTSITIQGFSLWVRVTSPFLSLGSICRPGLVINSSSS